MEMCKISRVRTQGNQIPNQPLFRRRSTHPRVANPLVEFDGALGGLGLEIGGSVSQTKSHCGKAGSGECAEGVKGERKGNGDAIVHIHVGGPGFI